MKLSLAEGLRSDRWLATIMTIGIYCSLILVIGVILPTSGWAESSILKNVGKPTAADLFPCEIFVENDENLFILAQTIASDKKYDLYGYAMLHDRKVKLTGPEFTGDMSSLQFSSPEVNINIAMNEIDFIPEGDEIGYWGTNYEGTLSVEKGNYNETISIKAYCYF